MSSKSLQDKLREKFNNGSPHSVLMGGIDAAGNTNDNEGSVNKRENKEVKQAGEPPKDKPKSEQQEPKEQSSPANEAPPESPASQGQTQGQPSAPSTTTERRSGGKKKDKAKGVGFKRRGDKFTDMHVQQSFYVRNEIWSAMEMLLAWGEKTYFVNEAFKRLILEDEDCVNYLQQNDPPLLEAIRNIK